MIKLHMTYKDFVKITIENVTVIDVDDEYMRVLTSEDKFFKFELKHIVGYTAEVI